MTCRTSLALQYSPILREQSMQGWGKSEKLWKGEGLLDLFCCSNRYTSSLAIMVFQCYLHQTCWNACKLESLTTFYISWSNHTDFSHLETFLLLQAYLSELPHKWYKIVKNRKYIVQAPENKYWAPLVGCQREGSREPQLGSCLLEFYSCLVQGKKLMDILKYLTPHTLNYPVKVIQETPAAR